ncbi:hypothetical protein IWQ57_006074 [Coemansia nantahalensis]|uniref:Uncharacterized protein n=1 Tax=Coemansia nantahalensis TaxID=2789366 RepID=A0ACC1JKV4_9FUNG|nr:hypothetical protein IWQ57_006074 [Coemansia nantahalensis]
MSADTAYMMMPSMYSVNPLIMESPQASATLAAASTGGAVGAEGRRRSPTDSVGRSGAGADHAQRRATHNAIERARRESLNGQFQDLASAVPALAQVRRPSKATIVEKSLEYIRAFREHMGSRDQYIRKLQQRNMALHDEVNRLRAQLGLELLAEPAAPAAPAAAAAIEEDEEADAEAGGSPHNAPATAPMAMSAPAHSTMQTLPLQKRRQQSLDLGKASKSARRPALRVQTARTTASHAAGPSGEGSDAALSSAAAASPLSAPLLTHPPQLPDAGAAMAARQHAAAAAAAAAAFVAHTNRPSLPTMPMGHLTAAQLGAMGVPMPLGMMTPNLTSPLQVGAMGGYLMAAVPGAPPPPPPFSLMDMAKLSEAFVVSSAAAAAMPLMAEAREPGSL